MPALQQFLRQKLRKQFHKYWQRSLPLRLTSLHRGFPRFVAEYAVFRAKAARHPARFDLLWQHRLPCLDDKTKITPYEPSRLYPFAWAAREIARTRASFHVDVGSSIEYSALVSTFARVERYAHERIEIDLPTLHTRCAKLAALPLNPGSVSSLSCLGVVEHQGLGRYGDSLNPDADLEVAAELRRVLGPGGTLLISVPVGRPRVLFNSHRVYSTALLASMFSDLEIEGFALVDDEGSLLESPAFALADAQENGIGCWTFRKPP